MPNDAQVLHDALRQAATEIGYRSQFDEIVANLPFEEFSPARQATNVHQFTITVESTSSRDAVLRTLYGSLPFRAYSDVTVTAVS